MFMCAHLSECLRPRGHEVKKPATYVLNLLCSSIVSHTGYQREWHQMCQYRRVELPGISICSSLQNGFVKNRVHTKFAHFS